MKFSFVLLIHLVFFFWTGQTPGEFIFLCCRVDPDAREMLAGLFAIPSVGEAIRAGSGIQTGDVNVLCRNALTFQHPDIHLLVIQERTIILAGKDAAFDIQIFFLAICSIWSTTSGPTSREEGIREGEK